MGVSFPYYYLRRKERKDQNVVLTWMYLNVLRKGQGPAAPASSCRAHPRSEKLAFWLPFSLSEWR